jgi:hypothetical protein
MVRGGSIAWVVCFEDIRNIVDELESATPKINPAPLVGW